MLEHLIKPSIGKYTKLPKTTAIIWLTGLRSYILAIYYLSIEVDQERFETLNKPFLVLKQKLFTQLLIFMIQVRLIISITRIFYWLISYGDNHHTYQRKQNKLNLKIL